MRTIERTTQFKRDFKREAKGRHRATLVADLTTVITELTGTWNDHRDCHVKPDLVLIYRLPDDETLQLARIGSHSELGIQVGSLRSAPSGGVPNR